MMWAILLNLFVTDLCQWPVMMILCGKWYICRLLGWCLQLSWCHQVMLLDYEVVYWVVIWEWGYCGGGGGGGSTNDGRTFQVKWIWHTIELTSSTEGSWTIWYARWLHRPLRLGYCLEDSVIDTFIQFKFYLPHWHCCVRWLVGGFHVNKILALLPGTT